MEKNNDNGEKKINRIERIGELKKQFKFENQRECIRSVVLFCRQCFTWEFSFRKMIQPNCGDTVSNLKTNRRVVVSKIKGYG